MIGSEFLRHDPLHALDIAGATLGLRDVGEVEAVGNDQRSAPFHRLLTGLVERADCDA